MCPDPNKLYPLYNHKRVMFIKNIDLPPNIEVGAYTYYDDPAGKDAFVKNVLYHFEFTGDHLLIGKFCCLATGTKFIMNGGNHRPDAFTTYPFVIFGGEWSNRFAGEADFPNRGDTIIGNDVWTGWNTTILPGVKIGNGAVIGASSVVTKDVPPYAIVAGNPARVVKMRFSDEVIKLLEQLKWWDWSIDKITENIPILSSNDLQQLKRLITC